MSTENMNASELLDVLESKYAMRILVNIFKKGSCKKTDLANPLTKTHLERLKALEQANLITINREPRQYNSSIIALTDIGDYVARQLVDLERVVTLMQSINTPNSI